MNRRMPVSCAPFGRHAFLITRPGRVQSDQLRRKFGDHQRRREACTRHRDFSQDTIEFLTATAALMGAFLQGHNQEPSEAARLAAEALEAQKRDVLLREMQHRVKNNFQIILASIAIQKRRYSTGDVHRALDHIASRINAISLAHDQLAPREEGQIVNLSDYLRALCLSIKQQAEGIEVDVQADDLELSIDRAVPSA